MSNSVWYVECLPLCSSGLSRKTYLINVIGSQFGTLTVTRLLCIGHAVNLDRSTIPKFGGFMQQDMLISPRKMAHFFHPSAQNFHLEQDHLSYLPDRYPSILSFGSTCNTFPLDLTVNLGPPLGPVLADLFMAHHEKESLSGHNAPLPPLY